MAYWYRPGLEIFGTLQLDCNVHVQFLHQFATRGIRKQSITELLPEVSLDVLSHPCHNDYDIIISFFICPLSVELLCGWGWHVNRPIHVALCKEVCETDFLAGNIQTSICHCLKNIGPHRDNRWDQFLFFPELISFSMSEGCSNSKY